MISLDRAVMRCPETTTRFPSIPSRRLARSVRCTRGPDEPGSSGHGGAISFLGLPAALLLSMTLTACGGDSPQSGPGGTGGDGGNDPAGGTGAGGREGAGGGTGGGGAGAIAWESAAPLLEARLRHTATLLDDGRVLVVGGQDAAGLILDSSELYDPASGAWTPGPTLATARTNHTAVKMNDGRVLLIGGGESTLNGLPAGVGVLASVEIFDPDGDAFSEGPELLEGRGHHQSVRLGDGRVLVVGGTGAGNVSVLGAETLAPGAQSWIPAGALADGRSQFGLALRASNDVVVAGGVGSDLVASAELFDPASNSWSTLPSMGSPRLYVGVAPLAAGGVLAAAGIGGPNLFLRTTEVLGADARAWAPGPDFPGEKDAILGGSGVTLLPLASGSVLATGAYGLSAFGYGPGSFAGTFDESAGAWAQLSSLDAPRALAPSVQLDDGRVLLVAGIDISGGATDTCSISTAGIE
jgi:hypothetical protein